MDEHSGSTQLIDLPREILGYLFSFLRASDLAHISAVCWSWYEILRDDDIWSDVLHSWLLSVSPCYQKSRSRQVCSGWGRFWSMKQFYSEFDFVDDSFVKRRYIDGVLAVKLLGDGGKCAVVGCRRAELVDSHTLETLVAEEGLLLYPERNMFAWNTDGSECCVALDNDIGFIGFDEAANSITTSIPHTSAINGTITALDYFDAPARLVAVCGWKTNLRGFVGIYGQGESGKMQRISKFALTDRLNLTVSLKDRTTHLLSLHDGRVAMMNVQSSDNKLRRSTLSLDVVDMQTLQLSSHIVLPERGLDGYPLCLYRPTATSLYQWNQHVLAGIDSRLSAEVRLSLNDLRMNTSATVTMFDGGGVYTHERPELLCNEFLGLISCDTMLQAFDLRTGRMLKRLDQPRSSGMRFDVNWAEPLIVAGYREQVLVSRSFELLEP